MGSVIDGIEERAQKLIAQFGYTPSEAASIAASKQSREHKLYVIGQACRLAQAAKQRSKKRA